MTDFRFHAIICTPLLLGFKFVPLSSKLIKWSFFNIMYTFLFGGCLTYTVSDLDPSNIAI